MSTADCLPFVNRAVDYICDKLAVGLSDAQATALVADAAVKATEAAVNAAALAGDVAQTKIACHASWLAVLDALLALAQTDPTLAPRRAGWERRRTAIAMMTDHEQEGATT